MKKKPGRPPIDPEKRKDVALRIRITSDELRRFEAAAEADKRSLANFIRHAAGERARKLGIKA